MSKLTQRWGFVGGNGDVVREIYIADVRICVFDEVCMRWLNRLVGWSILIRKLNESDYVYMLLCIVV